VSAYIFRNQIVKIYLDTETNGLDPYTNDLILIQFYTGSKVFLIDVGRIGTNHHALPYYHGLKRIMESGRVLKVFQNAKFDLKFLNHHLFGMAPNTRDSTTHF
jgi:ribonuclease D